MALDDVLARCIEKWRGERIPLAPPIAEAEVRRVWGLRGQPVSRDVLRLYETVGGFAEWCFDEEFIWCLWPWDVLREQNAELPVSEGVLFCDHSILVAMWEFRFEDADHSSVWRRAGWDPEASQRAGRDLESFLRTYLDDPWRLL